MLAKTAGGKSARKRRKRWRTWKYKAESLRETLAGSRRRGRLYEKEPSPGSFGEVFELAHLTVCRRDLNDRRARREVR